MKKGNFLSLLKATRVERAFYIVSLILVPAAFANTINADLLILGICCILLYSVSGIHNSKRDKDHPLPEYYRKFMILLVISTILLSLTNWIIFVTVIIELVLGVVYNTVSRKILFGDATVLGFSHAAIPVFVSSVLVGNPLSFSVKLAVFMYLFFWPIGNIRNQKDAEADVKRKYNTYATQLKNPRGFTKNLIYINFLIVLLGSLIFTLAYKYLIITCLIYTINIIILNLTDKKEDALAMQLVRLNVLFFSIAFVIDRTQNVSIITLDAALAIGFILIANQDLIKLVQKIKLHKQ